jgi:hypothetical protein
MGLRLVPPDGGRRRRRVDCMNGFFPVGLVFIGVGSNMTKHIGIF